MPTHERFGLALSGGGFRASFFHLGVLRRLAELDLLRHVTDVSTVSGGSILAAHYYLHFKRAFETKTNGGSLTREDYIGLVDDVADEFIRGNAKDLRNRLLMNPITHLNALIFGRGYGRPMANLYTKHFFRNITSALFGGSPLSGAARYVKDGIPLDQAITLRPGQQAGARLPNKSSGYPNSSEPESSLAEFNRDTAYSTIPGLVLNATCLNTGGPFQFRLNEVGGSEIGYVRHDELFMLLQYKVLITSIRFAPFSADYFERVVDKAISYGEELETEETYDAMPKTAFEKANRFPKHTSDHLAFYLAGRNMIENNEVPDGASWIPTSHAPSNDVMRLLGTTDWFPAARRLFECSYGELRRAKICAWYLLDRRGWTTDTRAGWTEEEYRKEFWRAVRAISPEIEEQFIGTDKAFAPLAFLILDLFYMRNADALHWEAPATLHDLTLSDAVAASANFPPIFTPFRIFNLFDQERYETLSLTDGGIHDNQGIEALLAAGCSYIIVSDAGGLVRPEPSPSDARVPMMDRVIDLLMGGVRRAILTNMEQTVSLARLKPAMDENLRDSFALRHATIFHLTSPVMAKRAGALRNFAQAEVAQLRTDLDAFTELEIAALRHQGYQLADHHLQWFTTDSASPFRTQIIPPAFEPDSHLPAVPSRLDRLLLQAGSHLAGRLSAAYPFRAALSAFVFAILIALVSHPTVSDLRTVFEFDASKYLDADFNTPRWVLDQELNKTRLVSISVLRRRAADWLWGLNLLAIPFGLWTLYLLSQKALLYYRAQRKQEIITVGSEILKDRLLWVGSLLLRPWNLISLVGLIGFVFTLRVKWLFIFLPLWTFIAALFFVFVHFVFTTMWLHAGRLSSREQGSSSAQLEA